MSTLAESSSEDAAPLWDRERDALERWLASDDPVRRTLAEVLREQAEEDR